MTFSHLNSSTWAKRVLLLLVVGILLFGLDGRIDLNHPFLQYFSYPDNCFSGFMAFDGSTNKNIKCNYALKIDIKQLLIIILFISAGILLWSIWDEYKRKPKK